MKRDNSLYAFLPMILSILVMGFYMLCWPIEEPRAQPNNDFVLRSQPPSTAVDSIAILKQQNRAQDSINLVKAREIKVMTKQLNALLKSNAKATIADPPPVNPVYLLKIGGEFYQVNPERYKEYFLFDADSVQNEIDVEKAMAEIPPVMAPVVEEYTEYRNKLQRAFDFITKPFKKKH